jgi:Na+-translocating ferredoxin:NAD+ oxidoreductase RnfC subunit
MPFCVGFVVDKVALGQVFPVYISPSMIHTHSSTSVIVSVIKTLKMSHSSGIHETLLER